MMLLQVKWKICQSISAVHYPIRHENMNLKEQSFLQQKMRNPQSMCVPLSSQMGHLVLKKAWTTIKKLLWNQKPARKVYSLISIGSGQGNLTSTEFEILVVIVVVVILTSTTQLWHVLDSIKAIFFRPEDNQRSWQDWHLNTFLIFIELREFKLKSPMWRKVGIINHSDFLTADAHKGVLLATILTRRSNSTKNFRKYVTLTSVHE